MKATKLLLLSAAAAALALAGFRLLPAGFRPLGGLLDTPEKLARAAASSDRVRARAAIAALRALGPAGLEVLFRVHEPTLTSGDIGQGDWRYLREAFDRVAAQRDAVASRLFWHTDLAAAQAEAARLGRPILSLRLLGRLDEELSCANSRMFRSAIYPDPKVNALLREQFVLHWQAVRPAPRITVDFGDGRKLETTISGNSMHLVLAADGRPVDALPGLYAAAAFVEELTGAALAARGYQATPEPGRAAFLARHHGERLAAIERRIESDLVLAGLPPASPPVLHAAPGQFTSFPGGTKNRVELPLIDAMVPGARGLGTSWDDERWSKLAERRAAEFTPSPASRALIVSKRSGGEGRPRPAAAAAEAAVAPLLESLRRSLAHDTLRNQYVYRRAVHAWYLDGTAPASERAFTERVYRELFVNPLNDGWLGMVPPDAYDGMDAPAPGEGGQS